MNPIHDYLVNIIYEVYLDRMNLMHFLLLEFQGLYNVRSMEATVFNIPIGTLLYCYCFVRIIIFILDEKKRKSTGSRITLSIRIPDYKLVYYTCILYNDTF